jgi:hypothetical protein
VPEEKAGTGQALSESKTVLHRPRTLACRPKNQACLEFEIGSQLPIWPVMPLWRSVVSRLENVEVPQFWS